MEKFLIEGGKPLKGEITVSGAKNAATPILAATLLTGEKCEISNVPKIEDVLAMIEIMKSMGASVAWTSDNSVSIEAKNIDPVKMNTELVCKLRSSVFLIGSLIARFGQVKMPPPGGCKIGSRSLEPHFKALAPLGVKATNENGLIVLKRNKLKGARIVLEEMSPTATDNAILAAVLASGETTITLADCGYSVLDLIWFLEQMGATISGIGTHTVSVTGVDSLKGASYRVMPDPIEAGTFLAMAAATRSEIDILNCAPEFIESSLLKFREANVNFQVRPGEMDDLGHYQLAAIKIRPASKLKAVKKVHNMPYPGFTPDILPPFAVLMTQAIGTSLIHDWMYEGRQRYVSELIKMGANAIVCDPHRVLITGPTPLYGREITSFDLRAGATLIIAALVAEGESAIHNIYQVDRGYERIEERLQKLGAKIIRKPK